MRRLSSIVLIVAAAGGLLLLPSCGDSPKGFKFQSLAKEGTGDAIKIAYDMAPGEGIRMKMTMRGKMEMSGDASISTPMNSDMVMVMKCTEVRNNGDKVLEVALEKMEMAAGGQVFDQGMLGDINGTVVIGADGRLKDMDYSGGGAQFRAQMDQVLKSPGIQSFVPMPPEGMRVGQALDLAEIMPTEALGQLMNKALPGGSIKPELRGELVLMGTREIEGEQTAEFAINLVMNMSGSMSKGGQSAEMDLGVKVSGTQYTSLKTGMPLGTSEMKMTMRGDVETSGEEVEINMTMTMTIDCTKL